MLKDDFIKITVKGNRKLPYFESLGYKIDGDFILVKISDLNNGSRQLVDVICDFCSKEVKVAYKEYLRNVNIGNKYACCKVCGSEKAKITNIEKYGVENALQLESTKSKQKKTNLEKYGVEYLQQSLEIKEKSKNTLLEKYGVDHISKIKKNRKASSDWMSSIEFKQKSLNTLLKNYNVDNPTKSPIVKKKVKETLSTFTDEDWASILEKFKKTNLHKYGVDNPMKSDVVRRTNFNIANHKDYIKYLFNGISKFYCENCKSKFEIKSDNYYKRFEGNLPLCTLCYPIDFHKSITENEIYNYIKSIYKGNIIASYRDGLEIDILLPDLNIGFEFNGLYWHSGQYKHKDYHIQKTIYFENKGIRIIHIWEDDWKNKQEILKSQIKNWIGKTQNRIFGRKCQIMLVDNRISKNFLDSNHIQGSDRSIVRIGLFHKGELVSIMTFDNFEGRMKMEHGGWNLSRFCNKKEHVVIGGASKLFKFFIDNYKPRRIISYADRSWSKGELYDHLGFSIVSKSPPDYKYLVKGVRRHKSNYRKSNLNTDTSESLEMKNRDIPRVWDCGKIKFEIIV